MGSAQAYALRLGFPVRDESLIQQALVHSSWLHEHPDAARGHNERLEFLGDAVVNLAISQALYARYPDDDEGDLSARRAAIVSTAGLARLAAPHRPRRGPPARRGRVRSATAGAGRRCSPRRSRRWPAPCTSTSGSTPSATGSSSWPRPNSSASRSVGALKSPKSRLQEHTQRTTGERPVYRLVDATGPDHERSFRIEVDGRRRGARRRRGPVAPGRRDRGRGPGDGPPARHATRTEAVSGVSLDLGPTAAAPARRSGSRASSRSPSGRSSSSGAGISAVVGPNGSGKSNLADALRWALGEQGRALRSRKAEDVIFAGSEKRTALGMADVTLVLDNADGLLPVDFQVLELGRRLYRSGENEYLLNKQRIRLRDLVDLLDAAHLADNAFLFIGQGMVDQALVAPARGAPAAVRGGRRRPPPRAAPAQGRGAAGRVRGEPARVEDILAELRPQARRLAAQAEQQASRSTIGEELTAALLLNAHARWYEVVDPRAPRRPPAANAPGPRSTRRWRT